MLKAILATGAFALALMGSSAQAATCTGNGSSNVTLSIAAVSSFTSCSVANNSISFTPDAGYVLISDLTGLNSTSGTFSPGNGYSSLELIVQSSTGNPRPDGFDVVFAFVSPFTWALLNGQGDTVSHAALYGLASTISAVPLPATLPLFVSGLAGLALLARRRKQKQLVA